MNRQRLFLEYILDRRAGTVHPYHVPETMSYRELPSDKHSREAGDNPECSIGDFAFD
jgi:hypothetical protein